MKTSRHHILFGFLMVCGQLVAVAQAPDPGVSPSSPIGTAGTTSGVAPTDSRYPLAEAHLFAPIWNSRIVYGESVLLKQDTDGGAITGTLFFEPASILRVRSSDGRIEYEQGMDYAVDAGYHRIVLTSGSRIPFITAAELYKKKSEKQAIAHKLGDAETYLLYAERGFPAKQVEVDYTPASRWNGYAPSFAGTALPNTLAKLRRGKGITIALTGDSISAGANASKTVPPYQPAFPVLLQRGLEQVYGGMVSLSNFAKGGATADYGLTNIGLVIGVKPDLVIIAYGMNDTAGKNPAGYQAKIKAMVEAVRAVSPETEFILVSSSLANPEWSWSQANQFSPYQKALRELTGPGIALADATALWTDLMKQKGYLDLTGNGINHPNDFGHRLYAQLLLALLVDPAATANKHR